MLTVDQNIGFFLRKLNSPFKEVGSCQVLFLKSIIVKYYSLFSQHDIFYSFLHFLN